MPTIELARRGYEVVLLDLTPENLALARRRIARAGVKRRVREVCEGSICELSRYPELQTAIRTRTRGLRAGCPSQCAGR